MSDDSVEIVEGADVLSMWDSIGSIAQKISICGLLLYFVPILAAIALHMDPTSDQFMMFIIWPFLLLLLLVMVWLIFATVVALFDTSGSRRALSVILLVPTMIGVVFLVIAAAFESVLAKVITKHDIVGEVKDNGEKE